jgi:hypothetical protein
MQVTSDGLRMTIDKKSGRTTIRRSNEPGPGWHRVAWFPWPGHAVEYVQTFAEPGSTAPAAFQSLYARWLGVEPGGLL